MGLIKFLMFAANVVFWAVGGTLLGVGIWLAVDETALDGMNVAGSAGMNDTMWAAVVYTMIGVGSGVFLLGFLGCVGAMKAEKGGKNIFLKLYSSLINLIFLAELVIIILCAIFWSSINTGIRDSMTEDVKKNYINETSTDVLSISWNKMQPRWTCCGGLNYYDYHGSNYQINTGLPVPWTCCKMKPGTKGDKIEDVQSVVICRAEGALAPANGRNFTSLNDQGCYDGLKNMIDDNATIVLIITCVFLGLQVVGLIFSCLLMKRG